MGVVSTFSLDSPLGVLRCAATGRGLALVTLPGSDHAVQLAAIPGTRRAVPGHAAAVELREYFAGRRTAFAVPLDLTHVTTFTRRVLEALTTIPFGETASYGEIAARVGSPSAARAVGGACGRNPIPVIVPCHRVLASSHRIGGFSARPSHKRALLALEGLEVTAHGVVRDARA